MLTNLTWYFTLYSLKKKLVTHDFKICFHVLIQKVFLWCRLHIVTSKLLHNVTLPLIYVSLGYPHAGVFVVATTLTVYEQTSSKFRWPCIITSMSEDLPVLASALLVCCHDSSCCEGISVDRAEGYFPALTFMRTRSALGKHPESRNSIPNI